MSTLRQAATLFSETASNDLTAMSATWGEPRGRRGGRLCMSELGAQLAHASPAYFADALPLEQLNEGTVLDMPSSAFRANGQWYDVSFHCEVDAAVTKVVGFAFRVGAPIPRSEWKRRRLSAE